MISSHVDNTYSEIWTHIQILSILGYTARDISFYHLRDYRDRVLKLPTNMVLKFFWLVLNNRLLNHLFLLSRQHIHFIAIIIIIIIRSMHLGNKQTHMTYFYESLCQNIYPTFASNNKNAFQ